MVAYFKMHVNKHHCCNMPHSEVPLTRLLMALGETLMASFQHLTLNLGMMLVRLRMPMLMMNLGPMAVVVRVLVSLVSDQKPRQNYKSYEIVFRTQFTWLHICIMTCPSKRSLEWCTQHVSRSCGSIQTHWHLKRNLRQG